MILQAFASGSNGNAFFINSANQSYLIDVGISRKRILNGIKRLQIDPYSMKYIFITHAHSDHVSGLPVLHSSIEFEIIATHETITEIRKLSRIDHRYIEIADNAISIEIGGTLDLDSILLSSFVAFHDINGAVGFSIYFKEEDLTVSYTTDNNDIVSEFKQSMRKSDFIILESNHDDNLLEQSRRPIFLKNRIKKTHLSNKKMIGIVNSIITSKLKAIFLAHLSGECNTPGHVCERMTTLMDYCERNDSKPSSWRWIVCTREKSSTIVKYEGKIHLIGGLCDTNPEKIDISIRRGGIMEYINSRNTKQNKKEEKYPNLNNFYKK